MTSRWRSVPKWQIITLIILFFPVGLYLLWRQDRWSKRIKKIITWISLVAFVAFFSLIVVFAPPTVAITSSLVSVKSDSYQLTGTISPTGSIVTVNGVRANVDGDTFSINLKLEEGDNTLKVVVASGDKIKEQEFKIHRYTKTELIVQEETDAKKEADEATAAAKKKSDDAAAAQVKQQQEADAKTKADADAAAKAVKNKAEADAAAKAKADADAAAAVTVSQKNALSKAKSYLSYAAFSHDGLVDQLIYEQFSTEDATYGADNVAADWNEQAAKKAKSYMSYSSFSRGGLIDQLEYEKFTPDQAAYGATSVGL